MNSMSVIWPEPFQESLGVVIVEFASEILMRTTCWRIMQFFWLALFTPSVPLGR